MTVFESIRGKCLLLLVAANFRAVPVVNSITSELASCHTDDNDTYKHWAIFRPFHLFIMPISRTGTLRAKSPRSSAATTPSNVSTPKFMPPSHYAAAGGYMPRQIMNKDGFSQGEHVRSYGKTSGTTSYSAKGFRSLTPNLPHTSSDSESSTLSNLEDHVPDLNELSAIKNGLPGLEAQLLPSLRDTIDRMTGGSSRLSPHATGSRTGDRLKSRVTITKESAGPWRTPTIGVYERHPVGTNARQRFHDTTNNTPTISYKSTPTSEASSRLKTPTKSALKSSLRSPATKPSSAISGTPESFHTAAPSPLKSMKSLLTRKCSGKLRSPFSGHKTTADAPQKVRKGVHHGRSILSPF